MHNALARRAAMVAAGAVVALGALFGASGAIAAAPSGAIFTTLADGSEVNFNIYPSKEAVYLDGGPGPGAPQTAAGLDDGVYVFQVTDPSGKTLLSTDPAACRRFTVSGGIITGVVPTLGCEHQTGFDLDHGATTVQLMPYLDTPNNGGVYKVWATLEEDYTPGSGFHGFIPSESKTDNYKVRNEVPQEIDTYFYEYGTQDRLLGLGVTWTDPTGASNRKWAYFAPELTVNYEAHVEAVTAGTHYIDVLDQPGCRVHTIRVDGGAATYGPRRVAVKVSGTRGEIYIPIRVVCKTN